LFGPAEALLFAGLSAVAAGASLDALRERQTYGLFRLLAFESLAGLIALNASRWFRDPLSPRQLVSWSVLVAAIILAAHGLHLLRSVGGARRRLMEDTEQIVEIGVYRVIRHPMYASLLLLGWGVFFKGLDVTSGALAVLATVFLIATARSEERFNVVRFGEAYTQYASRTKMFVPFIY
jgi:protein-S-isoprenylcysteine O-methyltransferase Ste14